VTTEQVNAAGGFHLKIRRIGKDEVDGINRQRIKKISVE